jgi:hypothetical protein
MRVCLIVICGLPRSAAFFHIPHKNGMILKASYGIKMVCFDFPLNFLVQHFSFWQQMDEI